ncbi:DUF3180 domain-containing protein [Mycobacterium sp. TNTM28]|uniref:DUF3180 domain-containing protein n=1 Tax=[Mycobacterium] fortunisiensis TaxID=2600579 RepID=A0ABS6KTH2_9MYCO|nr:DUF3180 domain-containing protein [[Mycobacterium] fortunisiensis]MBU9766901.1 DUF3180 domain-containing protein [[Mycobacterium] fortunisiensis]
MGPTRKRDLAGAAVVVAVLGYMLIGVLYQWFPPLTVWTGLSLLAVALAEAGWAFYVRAKISDGQIGVGAGRLHPLTVARSVVIAKASAWVGAVVAGWWIGVLVYLLPRRDELRVADEDLPGAIVAAISALALAVAAVWLQHCCRSPEEPPDNGDPAQQ